MLNGKDIAEGEQVEDGVDKHLVPQEEQVETEGAREDKEIEGSLNYEDIFDVARERLGVTNPQGWLNSIIFRRYKNKIQYEGVPYDEVLHESIVGLHLGMQQLGEEEPDDSRKIVANKINSHLNLYLYGGGKSRSEIPFSALGQSGGEPITSEVTDHIEYERGINVDPTERLVRDIEATELLEQAKEIITKSESRIGQGERDWEVFVRHISGQTAREISDQCEWLKNVRSAESAIVRIIKHLRECFDGDVNASVVTGSRTGSGIGGRTKDQKSYYAQWYERNKEERGLQMKEYMQAKRLREKIAKIDDGQ